MDAHAPLPKPLLRAPGAGATLDVLGVTHIYKATGAETGGSFSLWEAVLPPGTGAPPHRHAREDEAFYVLEGELLVESEGETHRLPAGGFFFAARGRRHAIHNGGQRPVRVLVLSAPSCGLDQMFAEFDAAARAGAPTPAEVAAIAVRYGVTIEAPGR